MFVVGKEGIAVGYLSKHGSEIKFLAIGKQLPIDFSTADHEEVAFEIEIDFDQFAEGVQTAYLSRERRMDEKESKEILDEVWKDYQERERAKRNAAAEITKKESAEHLAANLKKPGVKATASGLQYRVIKAGEGISPSKSDKASKRMRQTMLHETSAVRPKLHAHADAGGVQEVSPEDLFA